MDGAAASIAEAAATRTAADAAANDAATAGAPPPPPLRGEVLGGRFFGTARAGQARDLARFLHAPLDRALLLEWFGARALRDILAHDGTPRSRREAGERLREAVDRDIAALDARLHRQLGAVMAHPRLERLEGSWRGACWLAERVPYGARVKLRLLPLRWNEVCRDFERAAEFDQSNLFRKIYEDEFGIAGGEPFGMIVADYEVRHAPGPGHSTDDIAGLDALAGVAAAAFCPTAVAAHPALLGLGRFGEAGASLDLTEILRGAERQRWRNLQNRDDTRFLSVMLPRALIRAPWPDDGARADAFRPRGALGPRVWTSPAYALAATAIRAFARFNWPADVRGAAVSSDAAGGVVDGLPAERLSGDVRGDAPPRAPVELYLTDLQERQAVEAGLLPLMALDGLPEATFAATPALHRPPRMTTDVADANQTLSAQFNAMLCVSRFAHCIKIMGRDMVGAFRTPEEIEVRIQEWLKGFTNASAGSGTESGARYPLRDSRIEIREKPGQPGVYGCVLHLQPHYQLDEVGAAFRLVTDLQAARAAA